MRCVSGKQTRYFPAGSMPATASDPSLAAFGGTPIPGSLEDSPLMGSERSPGVWPEASFPFLACHNRVLRESHKNSSLPFPLPSDLTLQQGEKVLYHSIPRRDFQEKNLLSGTIPQECLQRPEGCYRQSPQLRVAKGRKRDARTGGCQFIQRTVP